MINQNINIKPLLKKLIYDGIEAGLLTGKIFDSVTTSQKYEILEYVRFNIGALLNIDCKEGEPTFYRVWNNTLVRGALFQDNDLYKKET